MTIRTQQAKVAGICFPVAEAVPPRRALRAYLSARVDVVDVQRPVVRKSARGTLAAKISNERELACPVFRVFVDGGAVLVPVRPLTCGRTVSNGARLSALLAGPAAWPARSKVTRLPAVMTIALADTVSVHFVQLAAMTAGAFYSRLFHSIKIARRRNVLKYFDIACRRIADAVSRPRLFAEPAPRPTQDALGL